MQFLATEAAVKSLYPDITSLVVPVIPLFLPEVKLVIRYGRYRVFG